MTTMSKSCMGLHFLLLLLFCYVFPSSFAFIFENPVAGLVSCRPHQIEAFTQFKNEFDTRSCNHSDYLNGVWCDNSGAVTKLRLRACLSGTLMPNSSLFKFHHLRHLDLSKSNFTSSLLPSEFGNLNRLEVLSLSYNGFIGQVPSSFSNLSQLTLLDLSYNEFTGSIPLLRNLSMLTILFLRNNHFSEGIRNSNSSLFESRMLRYLSLNSNNFSSSLPSELGNLNKLEILDLCFSGFFGQVPPTISNLTRLTKLTLCDNQFTGSFPLVQNLTKLSLIQLRKNHFSGTIPPSIFTLPFLSYLDLNGNNLNGSIEVPDSSTPSTLELLDIGNNPFEGKILESISKLTNLKQLDLSFLNTRYPIDANLLYSLKSLKYLCMSGNSVSPASLSSDSYIPETLKLLVLKHCGIKEFPEIMKTHQNLEIIDISNNRISGKMPEWLWSLPRLTLVFVSDNLFDGFGGSTKKILNSTVQILDLEANHFKGSLPHLPLNINSFYARNNTFTGDIPLSICNRSSLVLLDLGSNNFTGPVPQCLSNLRIVNLRKNNLDGSIPDKFYANSSLRAFDSGYNRLTGEIPRSLINCSSLEFLSLENNKIEDTFPFWLKALPNLQVLILRSNKFYGPISPPHHQGPLGFPELQIFEISDNRFTGTLPPNYFVNWKTSSLTLNEGGGLYMVYYYAIGYGDYYYTYMNYIDSKYKGLHMEQERVLTSYATIDFSGNQLEGQIPESIGLLKALIALDLSNNAFTGHIPLSLANLVKLESLDLSRNNLSGTIPNGLGSLSFLAYVNVSHNRLKGEIPQGTQITGQSKSSFEGNAWLCGLPLEESCFGTSAPPMQQHKQQDEEEDGEEQVFNWKGVAMGYGFGVLFGLAIAHVIASYKPEWLVKITCLNKRRNC